MSRGDEQSTRSPLQGYLERLYAEHRELDDGDLATYIPALAAADPRWFGICLVTTDGRVYEVGDAQQPFTIQSISKPFTYGLALEDRGVDAVLAKIGVEPSGEAFNSISLAPRTGSPRNPMINAGAIAAASLVAGHSSEDRLARLLATYGAHAGRPLAIADEVYVSERDTGHRNRAIAHLLRNFGIIETDPEPALDLYFRQCSVAVTCRDLAMMAACLANGGTNPVTKIRALRPELVPLVLSVMTTCGMYDYAGEWVYWIGMPAKSGVAGGVLAVLPGQLGIGVFSPRLDERGNSVRGVRVCRQLARDFGLHFLRTPSLGATAIRRAYDCGRVRSKRRRPAEDRARLDECGPRAAVWELGGDLSFAAAETTIRRVVEAAPRLDAAVLDLSRATGVGESVVPLLRDLLLDFDAHGRALVFVGTQRHARFQRRLEEALACEPRAVRVTSFAELDLALEWCENRLLGRGGAGREHAVGLAAQELCRGLGGEDLARLAGVVEERRFPAGRLIVRQGDPADAVYLVARGDVSVTVDLAGRRKRLATVSPGMSVGELAVIDRSPRSADVRADTDVDCFVLTVDALERLTERHPAIVIALLRNLLRAAAGMVVALNEELATLSPA